MRRCLDERCDERELRIRLSVAAKQRNRLIDVAQGAERRVYRGVLEHRARVEHTLELRGGQTPRIQSELLDSVQLWDARGVVRGHANRLQNGMASSGGDGRC